MHHSSSSILVVTGEEDKASAAAKGADSATGNSEETPSPLKKVTGDELYKLISKHEFVLAEFYSPWCKHCKDLLPALQKAATLVKEAGLATQLVQIDATTELSVTSEYGIKGYPTFKFFRNKSPHNPVDPDFSRTATSIFEWVMMQEKGPVQEITSEQLKSFIHDHRSLEKTISILAYAARKTKRMKLFEDFAKEYKTEGVKFFVHYVKEGETPKVDFYRWSQAFKIKDEEEILTYTGTAKGGWTKNGLDKHLKKAQDRVILEGVGYPPFHPPSEPMLLLWLITSKKDDDLQEYVDAILPLAQDRIGRMQVSVMLLPLSGEAKALFAEAGLTAIDSKEMALLVEMDSWEDRKMPIKYLKQDVEDAGAVREFVDAYKAKRLLPFRKSQFPVPEKTDHVVPIVAETFPSIALDASKHVFVMYMAPWCGHCSQLKPIWSEFAAEVARSRYKEKVIIANMDATANDLHDLQAVSGYPSLVIYPAGTSTVSGHLIYSGQRTKEDLWGFLEDVADVSDDEL